MNGQASPSRHASSIPSYITKTSLVLACSSVLVLVALIGLLMHDDALDLLATSKDHPAWEHEECRKHRLSTHIPKILHQSYKTKRLPADFAMWQTSWLQLHPHWCYMFWTDRDNRNLVKHHYPWFLRLYDSLPKPIMRADAARYLYMHKYGGLYTDLDIEALRSFDHVLTNTTASVLLAYMGTDYKYPHNIPNAFMASKPGHPLWMHCIAEVYHRAMHHRDGGAEEVTGPIVLYNAFKTYLKELGVTRINQTDIYILPAGKVYGYDWHDAPKATRAVCSKESGTFDATRCKALFPNALAVSYWAHSWEQLGKPSWANW